MQGVVFPGIVSGVTAGDHHFAYKGVAQPEMSQKSVITVAAPGTIFQADFSPVHQFPQVVTGSFVKLLTTLRSING
jgi:hypothetical protein